MMTPARRQDYMIWVQHIVVSMSIRAISELIFHVKPPLALILQLYAITDAMIPLRIDAATTAKLINTGTGSMQHPPDLQPGSEVIIKIVEREAARAKLVLLGEHGSDAGESQMWGSLYVGAHKAKVRIVTVIVPGAKVPFQHANWGPD